MEAVVVERTVVETLITNVKGADAKGVKEGFEREGYHILRFGLLKEDGKSVVDKEGKTHVVIAEKKLWELYEEEQSFTVSLREGCLDVMREDGKVVTVVISHKAAEELTDAGVYVNVDGRVLNEPSEC